MAGEQQAAAHMLALPNPPVAKRPRSISPLPQAALGIKHEGTDAPAQPSCEYRDAKGTHTVAPPAEQPATKRRRASVITALHSLAARFANSSDSALRQREAEGLERLRQLVEDEAGGVLPPGWRYEARTRSTSKFECLECF